MVLWFRDNERYSGPDHWESRDALSEALRKKCEEVSQERRVSLMGSATQVMLATRFHATVNQKPYRNQGGHQQLSTRLKVF
jgi:hypothetical protein